MPTISEPTDEDMRRGKARGLLEYFVMGMIGEATLVASLSILKYDEFEVRKMLGDCYQQRLKRAIR